MGLSGRTLVAMCLGLLLLACAPAREQPAAAPDASTDKPQYGGVLNLPATSDPPTLDLHSSSTVGTSLPVQPAMNPLVRYDPLEPTMTKVEPNLAERWEVSPDGKTFTFHLVKGVKFHQGGDFTAHDAKFSFERQKTPEKGGVRPRRAAFEPVERMDVVDDYTLRVVMTRPYASFLANIAQGWMAMLDKEWVEAGHDPAKEVNGTGPFVFKEYTRGVSVELTKNPSYWKKGYPYLDGVKYFIITDSNTILAACRTGNIVTCDLDNKQEQEDLSKALGDQMRFEKTSGGWGATFVNLSTLRKPYDDLRVRQALALAIDQDAALKVLRDGEGYRQGYMPAKGPWSIPPEELAKFPGYGSDVEKNRAEARRLLAEAGYPNGFRVNMGTRQRPGDENPSIFVKDQWEKIGVIGTLQIIETQKAYEIMDKGDYEVFLWGTAYAFDDPDAIFAEHYTCTAARNYSKLCVEAVDKLFKQQSETLDLEQRRKLVREMEKAALAALPKIVLPISTAGAMGVWNTLRDWRRQPSTYSNRHWEQAWLAKQ
ncbi:MAG: ABC transporter substrate-binding protein [Chloroflexi bacterium]|nr:ABC transporter substrate-binding protein [Chloroflexota bacterium]